MNREHLATFIWLRWRLMQNQWRRAGALNAILMMLFVGLSLVLAVPLGIGCFVLGLYAIPKAAPPELMYAWDGLVIALLFCWSVGLLAELQRTEALALSKFLHLPVSVEGAFLINYVSSLLCLSLIMFVPAMIGFCLALIRVKGPSLLISLPLLAAFLLMLTGVTYQFQGWLASLMSNPRRRRAVIVAATALFVLVFQLPNLINLVTPWGIHRRAEQSNKLSDELKALEQSFRAREFDAQEHVRRQQELMNRHKDERQRADHETELKLAGGVRWVNLLLPIGWLPYGVMGAADGRLTPALLGIAGMTLIGGGSLWRAYRTTVRMYLGQFTAGKSQSTAPPAARSNSGKREDALLEARVPGLSEPVAAIALAGLRSLVRAPEAKMMLLTPVLIGIITGAILLKNPTGVPIPEMARPTIALGAMALVLFSMLQLMANQFAFDRDGFRVFALCAVPRRDILLGKNLSYVPLALGLAVIMLVMVQATCPLRLDHFVAMGPLAVSMYLLFCPLANLLSIYAPMPIAAGSMKPSNPRLVPIFLQMAAIFFLFPLSQLPIALPLGLEVLLKHLNWIDRAPVGLMLALVECAAVLFFYRFCLNWQGTLLESREKRILEVITGRTP